MGTGVGRGLTSPLLTINFILYLVAACLAGWALNRNFDALNNTGDGGVVSFVQPLFEKHTEETTSISSGNHVTQTFLIATLIASVVGIASIFVGSHHLRVWRTESLAAAAATSLIAWLLTLLAMGVAIKEIRVGGYRPRRLKAVEGIMIVLSLLELLYTLSLHAGVLGEAYGPRYV